MKNDIALLLVSVLFAAGIIFRCHICEFSHTNKVKIAKQTLKFQGTFHHYLLLERTLKYQSHSHSQIIGNSEGSSREAVANSRYIKQYEGVIIKSSRNLKQCLLACPTIPLLRIGNAPDSKNDSNFSIDQNESKKFMEPAQRNPSDNKVLLRRNLDQVALKEFKRFKNEVGTEKNSQASMKPAFISKIMVTISLAAFVLFNISFKSYGFALALLLCLAFATTGQAYQELATIFDGDGYVTTRKYFGILESKVSGYIIAGLQATIMICNKRNIDGTAVWEFRSTCASSICYAMDYGSDDGYILVGQRALGCTGSAGPYVHKISESGATVWQLDIATTGMTAHGIRTLSSGNYVVVGYSSAGTGFLTKVAPAGTSISTTNPCTTDCFLRDITELPNGDLSVTGYRTDITPNSCYWALIPNSGGTVTERNFGYTSYISRCNGITALSDGTVALTGTTNGGGALNHGSYDVWALRLSTDGTKIWENEYGNTASEEAFRIRVMTPNYLMISAIRIGNVAQALVITNSGVLSFDYSNAFGIYPTGEAGGIVYIPGYGIGFVMTFIYAGADIDSYIIVRQVCLDGSYASGTSCLICQAGYYQDLLQQTSCKDCPVGTFGNLTNMTKCTNCSAGTYQNLTHQTSCTDCSAGYYQNQVGMSSCTACSAGTISGAKSLACTNCSIGTFQSQTGQPSCIDCAPGYFQNETGKPTCSSCIEGTYSFAKAISCSVCPADWYPSVAKDKCLYKGIFNTIEDYTSNAFSTTCYSSGIIYKPFTQTCRTAYHSLCCQGSTRLSTMNCSYGLNLPYGDPMFNTYCSACPFMNQAICPTNGLCWDDSIWTSNSASPYPASYSAGCVQNIKTFCVPLLTANMNDAQCGIFSGSCLTTVTKAEYSTRWDSFRITFKVGISAVPTNCSLVFNALNPVINLKNLTCTVISSTQLDVNVALLSAPLISFGFTNAAITDVCDYNVPTSFQWTISPPTVETVQIIPNTTNKCNGFTFKLSVTKPYPWNIVKARWNVKYANATGLSSDILASMASLGLNNETELSVPQLYLLSDRTLNVTVAVETPYNSILESFTLVVIPAIVNGRSQCGPCQLNNRSKCVQYNGICWASWTDGLIPYPTINQKCLKAMAPECYRQWKIFGRPSQECSDFNSYYNYALMSTKPGLQSVKYSVDGKFIIVDFNASIYNDSFVECSEILSDESLNWLPGSRRGIWMNKHTFNIFYDPEIGIMPSIKFKSNSIFYDYQYAQEGIDDTTHPITMPQPNVKLDIIAPRTVSECDTITINVINTVTTLYILNFRWEIKFSTVSPQMDKAALDDANFYFKQYTNKTRSRLVLIPSRYLKKGSVISAIVEAFTDADETLVGTLSTNIIVLENYPRIKFTEKNQRILNIESDDTEVIAIQTDNAKCQKGETETFSTSNINAEISFKVYSWDDPDTIAISGTYEIALSDTLNNIFKECDQLVLSSSQGFDYYKYYLLIAQMRDADTGNVANDSIILQFTKPIVESVVDSAGTLLSMDDNVELNGERSSFPESGIDTSSSSNLRASPASKDIITYKWKCIKADPLTSLINCECPLFDFISASNPKLSINKEKFAPLCTYTFGLAVAAKGKTFTRTAYNETEFIKYQGGTIQVRGKLLKGSQKDGKDIYLTFEMNTSDSVGNIKYEWELIEMKSLNPRSSTIMSQKKTFMNKFFKINAKDNLNGDQEIPESDKPKYITPLNRRIIGFNKDTLQSNYEYLFAVKAYFSKAPTFLYVKLVTPPSSRKRIVTVNPTNGIGLTTSFTITYYPETSNEIDQADYQIFRKECPSLNEGSITPITRTLPTSNSFTTILAPGKKSCNYQVEIIVRATEYGDFTDNSYPSLTIKESDQPKDEVMKNAVDSITSNKKISTIDEKLSIINQVTAPKMTEATPVAHACVGKIMSLVNKIDSNDGKIMNSLNDDNKVQMLNSTANIISNVVNNNAPNVNISVANSIKGKVDEYLNTVKDKSSGSDILSTCLNTLSGAANVGTERNQNNTYYGSMQKSLSTMSNMKLDQLQPGAPSYNMSSPAIEMSTKKNYADEFNSSQKFASDNGTQAHLPPGIGDTIMSKVSNGTDTSNNLITVGASLVATGYNPYVAMKSNAQISVDSLSNSSSAIVKPTGISQIYNDLSKGKMQDIVNPNEMGSNIMQFSLNPYQISNNAIESKFNQSLSIDQFPPGKSAEFLLSSKDPKVTYGNDTLVVPVYYVPENGTWSNQGCSVSAPNSTSQTLKANCSHLGKQKVTNAKEAFTLAIDVIKNVLKILSSGNYDMLYNFGAFTKVTTTNIIIYAVIVFIIIAFVSAEMYLYSIDATALFDARIKVLIQRYDPSYKEPSKGILFNALNALSQIRKKGMKEVSESNQNKKGPQEEIKAASTDTKEPQPEELPKLPNGFNILLPEEEKDVKELFLMFDELRKGFKFSSDVIREMIFDLIMEDCILARITQAYLDDEIIKDEISFCVLLRNNHPFVNAFAKPDLTTPRILKLFIVVSVIIGQLFVTGYFFDPKDKTSIGEDQSKLVNDAALYSIAAALLMIPLKVIISIFLVGKNLMENMTRQEIEKIEASRPLFRKIGFIFGNMWLLGCLYAILMFSISFTEEALAKWLITFWTSFGADLLIIQQLKILVTVCFGLLLMKIAQTKLMMTLAGAIAGPVVAFILNYF